MLLVKYNVNHNKKKYNHRFNRKMIDKEKINSNIVNSHLYLKNMI